MPLVYFVHCSEHKMGLLVTQSHLSFLKIKIIEKEKYILLGQ